MTQQNSVQKDTQVTKLIADLQKRVETLEDMLEAILSWIRKNRVSSREEIAEEARLHMQKLSRETKNV